MLGYVRSCWFVVGARKELTRGQLSDNFSIGAADARHRATIETFERGGRPVPPGRLERRDVHCVDVRLYMPPGTASKTGADRLGGAGEQLRDYASTNWVGAAARVGHRAPAPRAGVAKAANQSDNRDRA